MTPLSGPGQQVFLGVQRKRKTGPSSQSLSSGSPGYCLTGNEQKCTKLQRSEKVLAKSSPAKGERQRKTETGRQTDRQEEGVEKREREEEGVRRQKKGETERKTRKE